MGLFTGLLTFPLAPVRGTMAIAEQIRKQAMQEMYDPARIRHQLDEVERMRSNGDLSDSEAAEIEEMLIERLLVSRSALREM